MTTTEPFTDIDCPMCKATAHAPCRNLRTGAENQTVHKERRMLSQMAWPRPVRDPLDPPRMSWWAEHIIHLRAVLARTQDAAFLDQNTPYGLYDTCAVGVERLTAVMDLLKGRLMMDSRDVNVNGSDS